MYIYIHTQVYGIFQLSIENLSFTRLQLLRLASNSALHCWYLLFRMKLQCWEGVIIPRVVEGWQHCPTAWLATELPSAHSHNSLTQATQTPPLPWIIPNHLLILHSTQTSFPCTPQIPPFSSNGKSQVIRFFQLELNQPQTNNLMAVCRTHNDV